MRLRRASRTVLQAPRPRPGVLPDPLAILEQPPLILGETVLLDPASLRLPDPALAPVADEPLAAPGIAAWLKRHPRAVRGTAAGSIAAGVVLFSVAAVASSPAAKHHPAAARVAATTAYTPAPVAQLPPPLDPVTAAPHGSAKGSTAPRRSAPAPADPAAISGLAANGIPSVALNAYRVAAARMANVEPSCGIDWSLIAAIGRVESNHGTFNGAVLHNDGVSTPKIIGPALDGKHWDYIPAPGNGLELDGDAVYAHALGPMQFIPSTWSIYGADANGDGKADIFNINDAALGTARYLCAAGGDLRGTAGQTRAVLAYNHNSTYLAQVLALADAYHRGLRVTGIPIVGITKGQLPTVVDTGYVPPANPGDPTAVDGSGGKKGTKQGGTSKGGTTGSKSGSSSAPRPGGSSTGGSTAPAPTSTRTPAPTGTTPAPTSSGTTSTPPSGGGSTTTPPPSGGSSSPTCNNLQHLLGMC
ncbi:MAG: lytic transglycosylase domain-containing protein [Jatrophihabitans sp.]|uniref:lytic transglycosylase domain-containing protein n=1 Tax=Jatrophihabitans sp. TaxID=1932789 RepID=UPI003F814F22